AWVSGCQAPRAASALGRCSVVDSPLPCVSLLLPTCVGPSSRIFTRRPQFPLPLGIGFLEKTIPTYSPGLGFSPDTEAGVVVPRTLLLLLSGTLDLTETRAGSSLPEVFRHCLVTARLRGAPLHRRGLRGRHAVRGGTRESPRMEPRAPWVEQEGQEYWDRETRRAMAKAQTFRGNLRILRGYYNQSNYNHSEAESSTIKQVQVKKKSSLKLSKPPQPITSLEAIQVIEIHIHLCLGDHQQNAHYGKLYHTIYISRRICGIKENKAYF
uniref:MHC class I-like antigen recognition-like domain-containing protein n=1 Tax=Callithrix jacchus TaxID=9483 RepID=A0A8I3WHH3_CALJA